MSIGSLGLLYLLWQDVSVLGVIKFFGTFTSGEDHLQGCQYTNLLKHVYNEILKTTSSKPMYYGFSGLSGHKDMKSWHRYLTSRHHYLASSQNIWQADLVIWKDDFRESCQIIISNCQNMKMTRQIINWQVEAFKQQRSTVKAACGN